MYTAVRAIPKGVQWRPCVAKWHTFDAMAPPARCLSQVTRKEPSDNISKGTTSRPPSEPLSEHQACQLVSLRWTSARATSVKGVLWLSSWCRWTQTPSAWWGGDGVTQCSATSARRKIVSPKASQPRFSNMAPMRSFHWITPATSAKRHSRSLKDPSTRGLWRPGTGSVWYWRH